MLNKEDNINYYETKKELKSIRYLLSCAGLPEKHARLIYRIEIESYNMLNRHCIIKALLG